MAEIFVLTEHRQGQIRDITYEMLTKGKETAEKLNAELTAVMLGKDVKEKAKELSEYAEKVLVVENAKLENFNSEVYQKVLSNLIREQKPTLTMVGHTSYGVELAPRLAASLNIPLATDCIDLTFEGKNLTVTRQMYGGKVNVKATLKEAEGYMVTVRQAAFTAKKPQPPLNGEIIEKPALLTEEITAKRFVEYVLPPPGGVDITAAEKLVGIGRGIKDQANMPIIEEFAKALGAVLACSRPVVDKGWLPSDRQVGSSGKTVKPKLYIAVGISGAFQHVLGMKNSDLIIAINKDPNAPIFNFSDYGIVDDLFKVIPALKNKINELKEQKA
ncbi:MAG: electron transfer flavoprotein subunit alpha/FixB family protein [Candidatus Bathyarchaeia archaeon]|nr:MAG: electron transfer flavoprotein subunit alpha/FixB family protein [Candidatus Bathyarchaeota archaeon]